MSIKDIVELYGDSDSYPKVIESLQDCLKSKLTDEEYLKIKKKIYYSLNGGHYNEEFALDQFSKMYYLEKDKNYTNKENKVYAPYWTKSSLEDIYKSVKSQLPKEYNLWDFEVALNMIKSDYYKLLHKWYPEADDNVLLDKYLDLTINWLDDPDNPFGTEKVWKYFNS